MLKRISIALLVVLALCGFSHAQRFTIAKNNFTSGELDPRMKARDDVAQYSNGLETCENFQVMPFGGLRKRNGTAYVAEVKTSSQDVRLVRFEFSVEQAYVIEFGDQYLRFFKDQGQIVSGVSAYEISSPYLEADLATLKFTQSADVLYIAHPDYKPRKLSRSGHTSWTLEEIEFENGPFLDDNLTDVTIQSSGVVGNVTLTASDAIFQSGHVGSIWKLTRGKLGSLVDETLNHSGDTTSSISLAGSTVVFRAEGTWVGTITIERSFDNGSNWFGYETFTTNTSREFEDDRDVLYRANMTSYTSGSATVRLSQLSTLSEGFGVVKITGYTSSTEVSATVLEELTEETIGSSNQLITNGDFDSDISNWTDSSTGSASIAWNASQHMDLVGATGDTSWAQQTVSVSSTSITHNLSFDISGGSVSLRIGTSSGGSELLTDTTYTAGSHVYSFVPGNSTIYVQFRHSDNATYTVDNVAMDSELADSDQTDYWAEGAWSDYRGWPRVVGFYQQRLFFVSTDYKPSMVWGSVTADFENFKTGVNDDHAVIYNLAAQGVNVARWLIPWKVMVIGTAGSEWRLSGSSTNEALTATNVIAMSETNEGSGDIQGIQISKSIIFVDRTYRNIRELSYSFNEDAYSAPVLNLLAKHLTDNATIVDFAYQKNPDSIIWFVLSDGDMIGVTYNPVQSIVAFFSFKTAGDVKSIACIPGSDGNDELWMVVERSINGSTVKYIEYLNESVEDDITDSFYVDCGLTYSGSAATTLSGLDHLEGQSVSVLGDGYSLGLKTVTGGSITLSQAVTKAHIGLPVTSLARLMPFTGGALDGSGQGRLKSVHHLTFSLYNSFALKFGKDESNLKEKTFVESLVPLGPPQFFTGVDDVQYRGGVDSEQQITIVSDTPYPLHILSVVARGKTSQL